jgi:hypothetical protein
MRDEIDVEDVRKQKNKRSRLHEKYKKSEMRRNYWEHINENYL